MLGRAVEGGEGGGVCVCVVRWRACVCVCAGEAVDFAIRMRPSKRNTLETTIKAIKWSHPAPSGDHARRSPFCSLWTLRREPGPCGESRAPSGDHARRSPFCSLWTLRRPLRREPGPQRRQRAPQPLLEAAPSAVSGVQREPGPQRRPRAPQPLLQSLDTAPATAERAGPPAATTRATAPSGDSPFCSLWSAPATADVRCDKKGE